MLYPKMENFVIIKIVILLTFYDTRKTPQSYVKSNKYINYFI